jgi:hypothetical protein
MDSIDIPYIEYVVDDMYQMSGLNPSDYDTVKNACTHYKIDVTIWKNGKPTGV